ncbi:MAG: hypothetical protein ACO1SX_17345 [Actinomycetota bacterium]
MPILTEGSTPERVTRNRKGFYLLLLPPLLLLLLAISAAFRPLEIQLGATVILVLADPAMGHSAWTAGGGAIAARADIRPIGAHRYVVTGPGHAGYVQCHTWAYGVAWFQGHQQRPASQ